MDMLVRLYDLEEMIEANKNLSDVRIRRAHAPESPVILGWIEEHFGKIWRGEAAAALARAPSTLLVAHKGPEILGFACYDTTALGFFGPTGVGQAARGKGIGSELLYQTLKAMRGAGYAYAIIGDVGPVEFYQNRIGAILIEGSDPGIYRDMLFSSDMLPITPD
ncbi:GNAT family N-acetyltransferase [Aestuariispira insulae]|uniref:Putative N-acetyltransferase YhbS n=1 Tax=Aestuariispira insulae TaxID=1461337 RepID=A0A3D9HWK4_9PROT|nr:GNAT family N-acetyltransferase [Aestuariispira insulae]RED53761.1 putative N-acetyltransferase YhbS [Aestuariispira insulae]